MEKNTQDKEGKLEEKLLEEAKKGNGDSAYRLAELYYERQSYKEAVEWYEFAGTCKDPSPLVYFNLGHAYQFGEGVEIDMISAFDHYEKAAGYGLPQALHNLAYFYQNGIVVKKDYDKAEMLMKKANYNLTQTQKLISEKEKEVEKLIGIQMDILRKVDELNDSLKAEMVKNYRLERENYDLLAENERLNVENRKLNYENEMWRKSKSFPVYPG